jgi:hypothetical protein
MSELLELAFLLCARAKDRGLSDEEILWLVDGQIEHLGMMEALKRFEEEARK